MMYDVKYRLSVCGGVDMQVEYCVTNYQVKA